MRGISFIAMMIGVVCGMLATWLISKDALLISIPFTLLGVVSLCFVISVESKRNRESVRQVSELSEGNYLVIERFESKRRTYILVERIRIYLPRESSDLFLLELNPNWRINVVVEDLIRIVWDEEYERKIIKKIKKEERGCLKISIVKP